MTKEEILAMEAGRELDVLVALVVMKESAPRLVPENALDLQLAGSPVKSLEGNWLCLCEYDEGDVEIWRPLPFSTDISAAWQVVEKMRDADKYNVKRMEEGYKDRGQYDSAFVDFCSCLMEVLGIEIEESSYAATLTIMRSISPEAICKAALIARLEVHNDNRV